MLDNHIVKIKDSVSYNFKELVDFQITLFWSFLGIEMLEKYWLLKLWNAPIENWVYFYHLLVLYAFKKLWAKNYLFILWKKKILKKWRAILGRKFFFVTSITWKVNVRCSLSILLVSSWSCVKIILCKNKKESCSNFSYLIFVK
jgi:hypothetical protein